MIAMICGFSIISITFYFMLSLHGFQFVTLMKTYSITIWTYFYFSYNQIYIFYYFNQYMLVKQNMYLKTCHSASAKNKNDSGTEFYLKGAKCRVAVMWRYSDTSMTFKT